MLEVPSGLLELLVVRLPGQALELAGGLLRLGREVALCLTAARRRLSRLQSPAPLALGFLLLATRELLELLHELVDLVVGLLTLTSLHGLVLVLELVELELEEVRQLLGGLLARPTTAAAPLLLLHHDLVGLLGLLQVPERFLLVGQRVPKLLVAQVTFGARHGVDGER